MKTLKYILSAIVLLTTIWGCEDNSFDNLDFVETAVAPTNVSALFGVTQDNTGSVTITPNSEGAVSYSVQYGDDTAEAETVSQGESTTHIYAEGSYNVVIKAIGITGLSTEITLPLEVSFKAPENLEVTIANDEAVSKQVNVTATADYAISFDVYFGEEGNDDPISGNIDETVSYVYTEPGTYTIRVVAKGGAIETTEYSQEFEAVAIVQPIASATTPPTRNVNDVISVYSSKYTDISGVDFNPDWGQSGQGSSYAEFDLNGDTMLQFINLSYQGIQFAAAEDLTEMEYLHMDVWTADVTTIETSLISLTNGEKPVVSELTADQWTSIDIPISAFTDQGLTVADIHQLKFVGDPWAGGTVFIDNLYFYRAQTVQTQPTLPLGFESLTLDYGISGFGGPSFEEIPAAIITNPDPSGINTTEKVFQIEKTSGAQVWAGASIALAGGADFSEGTTIEVDVWSPTAGTPILYKMEDSNSTPDANGNPSVIVEVEVNTTVANQWETLSFDLTTFGAFSTSNSYDKVILFPNFNNSGTGSTYYFDNIRISGATLPAPTIPLNFESALFDYGISGFGGPSFEEIPAAIIENPDPSGLNTSGKVFQIEKPTGAQVWAGAGITLEGGTDFTDGTTVTVDVWSPTAGTPILYKMEDSNSTPDANGNPSVIVEVEVNTTVANQWETLTFDLTTFGDFSTSNSYDKVILFPNFNNSGTGSTYYFDNIQLTN